MDEVYPPLVCNIFYPFPFVDLVGEEPFLDYDQARSVLGHQFGGLGRTITRVSYESWRVGISAISIFLTVFLVFMVLWQRSTDTGFLLGIFEEIVEHK